MPIETLRADLARLREEIAAAEDGGGGSLARLEELAAEIERELDEEARLKDPRGLIEELEQGVSGFEASHPNLSAILNNIVSLLGSMGV